MSDQIRVMGLLHVLGLLLVIVTTLQCFIIFQKLITSPAMNILTLYVLCVCLFFFSPGLGARRCGGDESGR